jgi:hypothetical protein
MPALGKQAKTGMAVGLGKGFITTKYEEAPRPSSRKGVRLLPKCLCLAAAWPPTFLQYFFYVCAM